MSPRALAGLHHGYIRACNRPEGGAAFTLILPVSAASYTEDERTTDDPLRRRLGSVTSTEDIEPEELSPRDSAFMKELYALMDKELANSELDITRITEMMHISRTKFYYKVKGLTGENPSVFFKRYKLNRAADLLKEGRHNMSEIAYMTGFNTLSHFSTSFKKQFGVPPSEYVG